MSVLHTPSQADWTGQTAAAAQTVRLGQIVGQHVRAGDLIALNGELGAGKTQFTRGLAQSLGVDPAMVASPTFVLMHEYPAGQGKPMLVHVDAYRLGSLDELESIGWDPAAGGGELRMQSVLIVEWASKLGGTLGEDVLEIQIDHLGTDDRQVSIRCHGDWRDRLASLKEALDMGAAC